MDGALWHELQRRFLALPLTTPSKDDPPRMLRSHITVERHAEKRRTASSTRKRKLPKDCSEHKFQFCWSTTSCDAGLREEWHEVLGGRMLRRMLRSTFHRTRAVKKTRSVVLDEVDVPGSCGKLRIEAGICTANSQKFPRGKEPSLNLKHRQNWGETWSLTLFGFGFRISWLFFTQSEACCCGVRCWAGYYQKDFGTLMREKWRQRRINDQSGIRNNQRVLDTVSCTESGARSSSEYLLGNYDQN